MKTETYFPARELAELLFSADEVELTKEGKRAYEILSKRLKKSEPEWRVKYFPMNV